MIDTCLDTLDLLNDSARGFILAILSVTSIPIIFVYVQYPMIEIKYVRIFDCLCHHNFFSEYFKVTTVAFGTQNIWLMSVDMFDVGPFRMNTRDECKILKF